MTPWPGRRDAFGIHFGSGREIADACQYVRRAHADDGLAHAERVMEKSRLRIVHELLVIGSASDTLGASGSVSPIPRGSIEKTTKPAFRERLEIPVDESGSALPSSLTKSTAGCAPALLGSSNTEAHRCRARSSRRSSRWEYDPRSTRPRLRGGFPGCGVRARASRESPL
jgi:hypothetical protein